MSSIAAGTTTGSALVSTGDTTGELVLKTNGTTTAVTIDTNQNVTIEGDLTVNGTFVGGGDVTGPASSTDNAVALFDGTTGKVLKNGVVYTDANTASTVVQRDASGNFSAGTITAALTGNASTATSAATLTTARDIQTNLASTSAASFNGSANITPGVTGTLPVGNGGTGQTTYTDGELLIGNSTGNTLTKATLTAGTGITITNGAGAITVAASGGGGGGGYIMITYTGSTTWTKPVGLKAVKVTLIGGGGGAICTPVPAIPTLSGGPGGTSSFGGFASATGGAGQRSGNPTPLVPSLQHAVGGSGSGGDINGRGNYGSLLNSSDRNSTTGTAAFGFSSSTAATPFLEPWYSPATTTPVPLGSHYLRPGAGNGYGAGSTSVQGGGTGQIAYGGGGGGAIKYIPAPSIPGPVSVTVGAGGFFSGGPATVAASSVAGGDGVVIVEEFY